MATMKSTIKTGNVNAPSIGWSERDGYFVITAGGFTDAVGRSGRRDDQREQMRRKMRIDYGMKNAAALMAELDSAPLHINLGF